MLADVVDGLIEESEPLARLLIHNRSDGCPLRGTGTGATEGDRSQAHTRECRDTSVHHGEWPRCTRRRGRPSGARHGIVPCLIGGFVEQNAESTAGRNR